MTDFHLTHPSLASNWRAIILFGRNSASYKFALGSSILELARAGKTEVSLQDLALPYAQRIAEHLKRADKQGTRDQSKFLDACRKFNADEISEDQLVSETVKLGFVNVIDAFHVVNDGPIQRRFFEDDRKASKSIKLTDHLLSLVQTQDGSNLDQEVESRWRLVETAWSMDLAANLITPSSDLQFFEIGGVRRTAITSSRPALNGYQKGHCFYCFGDISLEPNSEQLPDVDHFFPWVLMREGLAAGMDGIWNLVLACKDCNRGVDGKKARVPNLSLLERLNKRNTYLIESHHPLRETLMAQSGQTREERTRFLQSHFDSAIQHLQHTWHPVEKREPLF